MKDLSFLNTLPLAQKNAFLNGPAAKPPPGITSNFENPLHRNEIGYGVTIFTGIFCTLLVALRLYARIYYHKKIVFEDGIVVVALGTLVTYLYCVWMIMVDPGIFVHLWDIRLKDLPHSLYYLNLGSIVYGNVIMLLKTGILLEWARIFVPLGFKNLFWWTCHVTMVVNVLFYVSCTFVEIFACNPRQKTWDATLPGTCLDIAKVNIVAACINFVSDLIILLLPQKVIWSLHMTTTKKLAIGGLFAVGILACIAGGFRLHSSTKFATSNDLLYSAADMGLWCAAEMVCGFMVLCLTAMPKLVKNSPWLHKIKSTFKSFTKSGSIIRPSLSIRDRLSIPNRRRQRPTDASLFTDTDKQDSLPFTNISIKSEFSTQTDSIEPEQSNNVYTATTLA